MARIVVSTVVEAPAGRVWELIGDFHALGEWHPHLPASGLGNELTGNSVGTVRVFELDGGPLQEALVAYDGDARSYTYSLPDGTMGVTDYRATLRVVAVTELDATLVEWSATYDTEAEGELRKALSEQLYGVFSSGLAALRERFAA